MRGAAKVTAANAAAGQAETGLSRQTSPASPRPTGKPGLKLGLSGFMFLQYLVWGAWYPSMSTYLAHQLKFTGVQIGAAYGAFAIGAIISPFFIGLIADRYFAAERLLAVLGVLGALALYVVGRIESFARFYPALVVYCALFVPTLALANSLAMQHLPDPKRDYPRIKVASALGWIAGSVIVSALVAERTAVQFNVAAIASVAFAGYALLLPHTPPKGVSARRRTFGQFLGLDALGLLRRPSFAIFVTCMFLISIPLKCYFVMMSMYLTELGWANVSGKMAFAQVSDIVFLFIMPVMLHRLGYKKIILLGIFAWVLRYAFLAHSVGHPGMQVALIFTAILLHGICYDFLYIAGQLYVNAEADDSNRSAAQGLIAFILWGIGTLAGTYLAGKLLAAHRLAAPQGGLHYDWQATWLTPALFCAGVLVVFALLFRTRPKSA